MTDLDFLDSLDLNLFPKLKCQSCLKIRAWDDIAIQHVDIFPHSSDLLDIYNFTYCKDKPKCKEFAEKWKYNENKV